MILRADIGKMTTMKTTVTITITEAVIIMKL